MKIPVKTQYHGYAFLNRCAHIPAISPPDTSSCVFRQEKRIPERKRTRREAMLLTDEQYVIKWLSQYGPLPKAQVVRLLRDKSTATAERLLNRMKRDQRIADVGDGYYLGLDPYCTPDQRIILAVWVLLQFIQRVEPLAHYPATYPSQLFFLKENTGYEVVMLYEGEQHLAKLLHPQEDLKYIFVLPKIQMAQQLVLPPAPCLFSTVEFQGEEEPQVHFFAEEVSGNGTA